MSPRRSFSPLTYHPEFNNTMHIFKFKSQTWLVLLGLKITTHLRMNFLWWGTCSSSSWTIRRCHSFSSFSDGDACWHTRFLFMEAVRVLVCARVRWWRWTYIRLGGLSKGNKRMTRVACPLCTPRLVCSSNRNLHTFTNHDRHPWPIDDCDGDRRGRPREIAVEASRSENCHFSGRTQVQVASFRATDWSSPHPTRSSSSALRPREFGQSYVQPACQPVSLPVHVWMLHVNSFSIEYRKNGFLYDSASLLPFFSSVLKFQFCSCMVNT
jgi:hypothetical protein